MKKFIAQTKVYSSPFIAGIPNGSSAERTISISGNRDFQLKHIELFLSTFAGQISVSFQDTSTNELWQNTPMHPRAITKDAAIIPFKRFLRKNTEILVKITNNSGAALNAQVAFDGNDIIGVAKE